MSFFAYMLRCADDSFYLGHTEDLERRIADHQTGALPGYTATRRPVTLVWSETFATRQEARLAERQLKGWSRAKQQGLIDDDREAVRALARRPVLRDEASPSPASPQNERSARTPPPRIVLVRPQLGENIGKAARAMLNFGLTDMALVAPRDGWPNPQAGPAASGADAVLAQARVFASVAEAVADCPHVFATTVRKRGVTKPVMTPEAAAAAIHSGPGRTAILFGPERSGLATEDVALARTILTVPINPEFGSLNLAQAVILVAYEWSKGQALAQPPAVDLLPPAPQVELDGMIAQLTTLLDAAGYFFPPDKRPTTELMLRTLLTKPAWDTQEVRTVRGILSALDRPRARRTGMRAGRSPLVDRAAREE